MKQKKYSKKGVALVVAAFCATCIAITMLFLKLREYNEAEMLYEKANALYTEPTIIPYPIKPQTDTRIADNKIPMTVAPGIIEWWEYAKVDLGKLSAEYPETVGWIWFEELDLSYPILQAQDNEKYLHTAYDGTESIAGAIFLDCNAAPDFSDSYSVIYGRNMRDLSMFGQLKLYETDKTFYEDHQYFLIYTGNKIYRYQIIEYGKDKKVKEEFETYQAALPIITLSTGAGDGVQGRKVIAMRVDEHIISE